MALRSLAGKLRALVTIQGPVPHRTPFDLERDLAKFETPLAREIVRKETEETWRRYEETVKRVRRYRRNAGLIGVAGIGIMASLVSSTLDDLEKLAELNAQARCKDATGAER